MACVTTDIIEIGVTYAYVSGLSHNNLASKTFREVKPITCPLLRKLMHGTPQSCETLAKGVL